MTFSGNKIYIYRDEGEKMEGFKTEVNKPHHAKTCSGTVKE
jgi:hypothetical protein